MPESFAKTVSRYTLALLYVAAGLNHFVRPQLYVGIMPGYLPWPTFLVYLSGVAEIALGAMLLTRRWRVAAAWGLIALLIAVFPANVHMAVNADQYAWIPQWVLWIRLPLQAVLITWAWWHTKPSGRREDLMARDRGD